MKHIRLFENFDLYLHLDIKDKLYYTILLFGHSYDPSDYSKVFQRKSSYLYDKYTSMTNLYINDINVDNISKKDEPIIEECFKLGTKKFKDKFGVDFLVFCDNFILITDCTDIPINHAGLAYNFEKNFIELDLCDDESLSKKFWTNEDLDYLEDFAKSIGMKVEIKSRTRIQFEKN